MSAAKLLPRAAFAVALLTAAAGLIGHPRVRGLDIASFASLPVLDGGRIKPLDSVARNSLLVIRSQQSFSYQGRTIQADEWLADVLFDPMVAANQPVFVINDPEVLGLMGLKQTALRYFSFETIRPHLDELEKQANAARPIEAKQRTRFQSAVVNLFDRVYLYYKLQNTVQSSAQPLAAELAAKNDPTAAARRAQLAELASFRILPGPDSRSWKSVGEALAAGKPDSMLEPLAEASAGYAAADPSRFNSAVAALHKLAAERAPQSIGNARNELLFNRAQPFYAGMIIYVLALLCLFASYLWKRALLQPTAFALLCAGAIVHTAGLIARILLQGRPPVTNLYSSAIFVGWAAVLLGILLEWMYRKGFGIAVAAAAGFASLIIAHHLASDGDTMEMMRAVLDSNFWLATHVTTITIGYSGTFLAGALAIGYTVRRHFATTLRPESSKALASMTYGVIAFALFFSFVGTVLGGIWADQSWGRFWGWDPKENGALLIVLWNAVILHARWGGYARERGIMAMAIFGNVITSLSWFGVNMLGVGLHSYGFMDSAFWALSAFIGTQLVLIAFCMLPPRFWKLAQRKAAQA